MFSGGMHPETIALDAGSSGCRAARFSKEGEMLLSAEETYGRDEDDTLDPLKVLAAVRRVLHVCDWQSGILAPGSIMHSLLRLDKSGRPAGPCSLWNDSSAAEYLIRHPEPLLLDNGCPRGPHIPLFRILARPEYYRGYRLVSLKNFLISQLLQQPAPEDWTTAAASGCLDLESRNWALPAAIADFLPFLPDPVSPLTRFGDSLAGTSDGALAHLGSCGLSHSSLSLTMGTTMAVRLIAPRTEQGLRQFQYPLWGDLFLHGLASNNAGFRLSPEEVASITALPEDSLLKRVGPFFDLSIYDDRVCFLQPLEESDDSLPARLEAMTFLSAALCEELADWFVIRPERVVLSGSLAVLPAIGNLLGAILPFPLFLADRRAGLFGSFLLTRLSEGQGSISGVARVLPAVVPDRKRYERWKAAAFVSANAKQ